jgi:P27 family predicted phage terminase small subunit
VPDRRWRLEPMPRPIMGEPEPPAWLEGRARELWDEWAPLALAMGTLTTVDTARFAQGCQAMADYEYARRLLARGWTTTGQKGARVVAPAVQLMRDAEARFDRFCARFGFDPSSRATLKVAPPTTSDADSPFNV